MRKYGPGAIVIIVAAVLLRVVLISQNYPLTNSDESTMGLMALHIAYRGEHPIFFYGQNYMGSLEAYLGALFFHLFGPSTYGLRLGLVVLFLLFLISMYLLTALLYSKGLALFTLVLFGLGADGILRQELWAMGGYPEILLFGALMLLIASWLALSSHRGTAQSYPWWRYPLYGCWGLAAGLGLWSDLLILPFVLMSALMLLVGCWREWKTWALPCLLLGLVIGALPLIVYNLSALPGQDSLSVLLRIRDTDRNHGLPGVNQVIGAFFVSLPIITGVNPTCPVSVGQRITFRGTHPSLCWLEYAGWGTVFTLLWIIATVLAVAALWNLHRQVVAQEWTGEKRQAALRHLARLTVLGSAGLTTLFYAISSNAAYLPQMNDRYLTGVLIAIPAVIAPLWFMGRTATRGTRFLRIARVGAMLLIGLVFLGGTLEILQTLPAAQNAERLQEALAQDLLHLHLTRIYSEYWTCDRIIFQSDERIICAVIDEKMQIATSSNRYTPYVNVVRTDPRAAYVLPDGSLLATSFAQQVTRKGRAYRHLSFDGYQIYIPLG
jgi:4-amino-4-deoxy-L-arabinose transferase-like glycosyltransferase